MAYSPKKIEQKWQGLWEKVEIYKTFDKVKGKKNFYHLVMFPYPSGDLHIGHWYNFAPADVYARFKRLLGFNVLSPIGFDAFGLPAENAALKRRIHPQAWTHKNIKRMRKQLKSMGTIYDWSREIITSEPEYYKWTQWMFLQLYKKGLVLRQKAAANFCPSCKTVLANEQVVEGKCERCDSEVQQKEIEQWLFKISAYAEDLLKDIDNLNWPETTKIIQRNWLGKSKGYNIKFTIQNSEFELPVFTTRTDTLFGCTYLVLAPEHQLIQNLKSRIKNLNFVEQYIEVSRKKTERERISKIKAKTGVEIKGIKAINPVNGREVPIFVADYVLLHYGTGAIMAVPAHDNRDWDFAKKYNLPIIEVIKKPQSITNSDLKAYEGEGVLVNSQRFNGMPSKDAQERIGKWLAQQGQAENKVYWKLRDWLISRQRYWGTPIPMIFCKSCGWQPVKENDLPVLLPKILDYWPSQEGKSPLAKSKAFTQTFCPKCHEAAERETDTMDTFVCSSWYFLRYSDPQNEKEFAAKNKIKDWLPLNMYIGGKEHTVLHLLYSRFFTKVLKDQGYLNFKEPFLTLFHQGIILGPDGQKMSKSKGNVIDPDIQVKKHGADTIRMYLCFMGPYSQGGPWQPKGIVGIHRFLQKIDKLTTSLTKVKKQKADKDLEKLIHKTIKKVTEDIENLRFNTAISALMILVNGFQSATYSLGQVKVLLLLLAPFAPHLTEELWQKCFVQGRSFEVRNSIHNQKWPKYNPKLIEEEVFELIIQINGKVRDKIEVSRSISEKEARSLVLKRERVKKWLENKEVKKIIFVPGKLINLVV